MLIPRSFAPALTIDTVGGGRFILALDKPSRFSLLCFYHGFHCPVCSHDLKELDRVTPAFSERGVTTIAIGPRR
jgi:peroxiredoxin